MSNSGIVFRWLPSNQKEIRSHRMNKGRMPNLQAHINKMHLNYIAMRPGAALNEKAHGIFGYIFNPEDNKINDCDELELDLISKRVGEMSKKGIDVFKTVISLKEEDAINYGYTTRRAWKGLLELKINAIAKEYKIPVSDLEWTASYHTEAEHFHCHLLFWDRNQNDVNKKNNKMPFIRYEKIRKSLAKEVFKSDYMFALENKNTSKNRLFEMTEKEIEELMLEVMPGQVSRKIFTNKVRRQNLKTLNEKLSNLENIIKQENLKYLKTDKINYRYGYQQNSVKEYIDNISLMILESSSECKIAFDKYIKDCVEIQKTLGTVNNEKDRKNIEQITRSEILNKMGNIILKNIKQLRIEENRKQYELAKEKYKESYNQYLDTKLENQILYNKLSINDYTTLNTIEQIFRNLSNMSNSSSMKLSRIKKDYGNFSKTAKIEYAKLKANASGFEWGND